MDSSKTVIQSDTTVEVVGGFANINVTFVGKFNTTHTLVFQSVSSPVNISVRHQFQFQLCGPGQQIVDATLPFCTTCDTSMTYVLCYLIK
jgi:hypothetical protein